MAKGDDLQDRLINFAVSVVVLTPKLTATFAGKHIANQLMRSGTSAAPNYAEARGAESTKDFIHKLKIVLKELNESKVWLEIVRRSSLLEDFHLNPVFNECIELQRIIAACLKTASKCGN